MKSQYLIYGNKYEKGNEKESSGYQLIKNKSKGSENVTGVKFVDNQIEYDGQSEDGKRVGPYQNKETTVELLGQKIVSPKAKKVEHDYTSNKNVGL